MNESFTVEFKREMTSFLKKKSETWSLVFTFLQLLESYYQVSAVIMVHCVGVSRVVSQLHRNKVHPVFLVLTEQDLTPPHTHTGGFYRWTLSTVCFPSLAGRWPESCAAACRC